MIKIIGMFFSVIAIQELMDQEKMEGYLKPNSSIRRRRSGKLKQTKKENNKLTKRIVKNQNYLLLLF